MKRVAQDGPPAPRQRASRVTSTVNDAQHVTVFVTAVLVSLLGWQLIDRLVYTNDTPLPKWPPEPRPSPVAITALRIAAAQFL